MNEPYWRYSKKDLDQAYERGYHKAIAEFLKSYHLLRSYIMRFYEMDEKYNALEHTIKPALEKINNDIEKWEQRKE